MHNREIYFLSLKNPECQSILYRIQCTSVRLYYRLRAQVALWRCRSRLPCCSPPNNTVLRCCYTTRYFSFGQTKSTGLVLRAWLPASLFDLRIVFKKVSSLHLIAKRAYLILLLPLLTVLGWFSSNLISSPFTSWTEIIFLIVQKVLKPNE